MESMKILVVDDEASVRELIRKGLSQKGGYNVEDAQNGVEAIEKIEKDVFDLVLPDLMMPGMDGLKLLKAIKGTRPEVMVILMTGHGSIETAVEAMKIGANDYITKPIDFNELFTHISKAQKESSLLKENRLLRMEVRKKFEFNNIIEKAKGCKRFFP
jgi:DNA-binding NtrC family response regulator